MNTNISQNNNGASYKDIPEDTPLTCVVYDTSVDPTDYDDRLTLYMNVMLPDGRIVKMRDIVYFNASYQKKIDAIYRSMSLDPKCFKKDRETGDFSRFHGRSFQLTFKKNDKGYKNAYTYITPNTAPSAKSINSTFGAKRGQIHNEYMNSMHSYHQTKGHISQLIDSDNRREQRAEQWN